jgi:hypothetical protein
MKNGLTAVPTITLGSGATVDTGGPSFLETVGATLAYRYDPLLDAIDEINRFGVYEMPEEGFSAADNISPDLQGYKSTLYRATSQDHLTFLEENLRQSLRNREVLNESGMGVSFAAEIFDPINWVSIPLARGLSTGRAALKSGAGTAAIVAGQETIRYPLDPLSTPAEVQYSIGGAFFFGGALGGLSRIPMTRRARAIREAEEETKRLREMIDMDDATIAPNVFTDSWLYKAATTPMKRVLQDPDIPESVKVTTLEIANDAGILLAGHKQGKTFKSSVYQNTKLLEGEWVQVYDDLVLAWGESTKKGVTQAMDYMYKRKDFEAWLSNVDAKAMKGLKAADEAEARAMKGINDFYERWEKRLREEGLIGDLAFYVKDVKRRKRRITQLEEALRKARDGKQADAINGAIRNHQREIDSHELVIADLKDQPVEMTRERVFRPRYWDREAIKANRQEFEDTLFDWFINNPSFLRKVVKDQKGKIKIESTKFSTKPENVRARVKSITDDLLGQKDVTDLDVAYFGIGVSKHMKHRVIDIPNERVLKFIHTNPVNVMKTYTQKVGARYEFSRQFGQRNINELMDDTRIELLSKGVSLQKTNAVMKDMRHLYERVAGSVLRNPDSLDMKTAQILRDLAQLNYLGSAGIATITEPAKIIMEHGLGPTMRGLFSVLKDSQLKMGAKELRIAGEALEILMGSSHMRLVDDLTNNPLKADIFDKAKNYFYLANGLAPITRIFKDFDGMMRSHTLIDYSVRMTNGNATKMEIEYLARYGIDADDAAKIAKAPWQRGESGLYIANTEAWKNTVEFPETKATIISGNTNRYDKNGNYVAAHFRPNKNGGTIFIDEDYIKTEMFEKKSWKSPRVKGVMPIPDGIINTPDDLVQFVKMHEIYHSLYSAKDLGNTIKVDVSKFDPSKPETLVNIPHKGNLRRRAARLIDQHDLVKRTREDMSAEDIERQIELEREYDMAVADLKDEADKVSDVTDVPANENAINQMVIEQFKKQPRVEEDTLRKFRVALSSGAANTILMGTPADKPIITDGVAYIPLNVARQFSTSVKPDKNYPGYVRVENGLLGLPFQFYSYALAATNKIAAAHAHGQVKSQFLGLAISMGLGYMVLDYKTPDFVELSFQDKLARSFDYSGTAALYSDLFYTAMTTSLALGGPNLTNGFLQPRFPQEKNYIDAVTGLAGAGPSIGSDYVRGMYDIVTGNVGEGTKEIARNLPFARMWFWKGTMNNLTRMLENEIDDYGGFGRY